ncbi:MAG: hypothetical protein LR011_11810 [Verrucomicrobia bacterium]|nr:hypothetical protein [Verrucomicrobiota bacterium]
MKRVLLTHKIGWTGILLMYWGLIWVLDLNPRIHGQPLGPQGGSYHFIGSLGHNSPSLYVEWLVQDDGRLKGTLYTTKNGVRSLGAFQAPDTIEAWISPWAVRDSVPKKLSSALWMKIHWPGAASIPLHCPTS